MTAQVIPFKPGQQKRIIALARKSRYFSKAMMLFRKQKGVQTVANVVTITFASQDDAAEFCRLMRLSK